MILFKTSNDIYETAKLSINHSKVKTGMPSNVSEKDMKKCKAPTLVMAAEKDCLFPAKGVIPRAKRIIENCTTIITNHGFSYFLVYYIYIEYGDLLIERLMPHFGLM